MSAAVMLHLLRERFYWGGQPRVPEPDLVMHSAAQTNAFALAGEQNGVLAFLYLYNALQISTLLRPGDRVLDLACGPANQLAQIARLNPQVQFVGLDASPSMLQYAQGALQRAGLDNVALRHGDMTNLSDVADASVDCVTCTMSLHHLPDTAALHAVIAEIRRVLKSDGHFYLVDFGRLKLHATQRFFAKDLRQSAQFTEDYYNSLRAAFSVQELSQAAVSLGPDLERQVTLLAPFIVVLRSRFRQALDGSAQQRMREACAGLPAQQQSNLRNLAAWFRASGYPLPYALD